LEQTSNKQQHGRASPATPNGLNPTASVSFATRAQRLPPRLIMLVSFGAISVINYGFSLAMGWLLTPGDFGLLAFVQSIFLLGGLILQSGIAWTLSRSIVRSDLDDRNALIRGSLLANLVVSLAITFALVVLFVAGPLHPGFESWGILVIAVVALNFVAIVTIVRGAAQGIENFAVMACVQVVEVAVKAGSGVLLVLLGFGVLGAAFGLVIGGIAAAVAGSIYLLRHFQMRLAGPVVFPSLKVTAPMFGALLGLALLLNEDLLAVKLLLLHDRAATGYYQSALVLANLPYFLASSALVPILFTHLSRYETFAETRESVGETIATALIFIVPVEFVLFAAPVFSLTSVFPNTYAPGAIALRFLAFGNALLIIGAILSAAFQAIGHARIPAHSFLIVTLLEAFILAYTVPHFGITGAAATFATASVAQVVILLIMYIRSTGANTLKAGFRWTIRYGLAVGLSFSVGAALSTSVPPQMAIAIALAIYGLTTIAFKLIPSAYRPQRWIQSMRRPT
jgi:O-antigen/teichoic acid export membrane protein